MERLDYTILKNMKQEIDTIETDAKEIKKYNIEQNYLRAVSKLCNSGIITDWLDLNQVTNFDYVKTGEYWDDIHNRWKQLIDKQWTMNGKEDNNGILLITFNPQTTWVKNNGGFGAFRDYCGDTNMLSFGPKDVDLINHTIRWHEYRGTRENKIYIDGSYFGEAYELKTTIINELINNYERYRQYAYDKTMEHLQKKKEKALEAKYKAIAILTEEE